MANIQQAAKWMKDGEIVRRPSFFAKFGYKRLGIRDIDTTDGNYELEPLNIDDLLAEDWEIFEWVN